ncbi:Calcipressin [Basidiobolus meristosporus CBS 931.73]|uniref:Calcipressin n=1 Tax=Basidiobolus meristosporus CBS 931.73 TaxID=1314790 RepID=A0A1Y1XUF1_9FUNG|nr:Calcipressin [Basidiobolus meristosporus CBS 931.73]|eukprot:ORX88914.1 Calcipressin [Basidiobolus meristosporus CBS 931.73]
MSSYDLTNTLIFTNLAKDAFLEENFSNLQSSIEVHGAVTNYAQIKSFSRLLVSFESIEHALQCKLELNGTIFLGEEMKIYFSEYNYTTSEPTENMLKLPDNEKLWLVSPPGSPPVGWLQEREEPPNNATLADDLFLALSKLADSTEEMEASDESSLQSNLSSQASSEELVFHIQAGDGEEEALPMITVQDYEVPKYNNTSHDISSNQSSLLLFDPLRSRRDPVIPKTPLPPILR